MKAVVYNRPESFRIAEIDDPEPGPGEVLVRTLVVGVCGTDLHLHEGDFGPTYPLIPGHEIVGEVVGLGAGVETPAIGQRVVLDNTASCGRCHMCRRARPAFCERLVAQGVNAPGGFAELVCTDANRCFVVDDLEPDVAVFAEPLACVVHGLDVLALSPGSDVLIFGAGPTGLLLAQLLSRGGAGKLVVAAPSPAKLQLAERGGADHTVQARRDDPGATATELRALQPDGFDVVIDATGSAAVLAESLPLTRVGGTVFVYGVPAESSRWSIEPYDVFRRELTIKGSFAQQFSFDRSVAALRSGRVDVTGFVTDRFSLAEYPGALAATRSSASVKTVIVG